MSSVWKFFKKEDNNNDSASCNLCGKSYKTCGNTTNLATHLKNRHHFTYLQMMKMPSSLKTTKYSLNYFDLNNSNVMYLLLILVCHPLVLVIKIPSKIKKMSQSILLRWFIMKLKKRKQSTLVACLERGSSFEEGGQKHSEITQALIYMICKDNLPLSCVEKKGLQKLIRTACPLYILPSRKKVTHMIENRYNTTKAVLMKSLTEQNFLCFTSDILTLTNSTRSFLVLTVHFIDNVKGSPILQNVSLCAQKLTQAHSGQYIKECWEEICEEFHIDKNKIVAITTDGGAYILAAVRLFLGNDRRISCMAHCLNLIVDGVLKENHAFSALCDHVKSIVTYFKQSVNAMDQLRSEQEVSRMQEGEVLTLTQAVTTRWNSCFDMLKRFTTLSALVAKILATKSPFKEATEEISGANYVTSSLAIPVTNLIRQAVETLSPSTSLGLIVKEALLKKVQERLVPLQENSYLSAATILDPRFKKIHFNSPIAVSHAIAKISNDIRSEHRRRGQLSPDLRTIQIGKAQEKTESSIWSGHEKLLSQSTTVPEVPSSGSVPNELKQYLDQPLLERKADPIKFWTNCQHFTPVLSEVALKYLICQASSVSSERVASAVNITVPDNRSRLTGEHVKQRVLLMSISDEYWFD
ncbi:unnamed protein product [Parnassius apollo]|uniref:(apollo) hypothetical protein n=1 Tax=Parnassius apollo TaxID=110799 RepID=A0A8S3XT20_PARAO|nr:unnamed protein product [Parnassius apollo]CAG5037144.1 unnamed protein product [Parnassius apollo]